MLAFMLPSVCSKRHSKLMRNFKFVEGFFQKICDKKGFERRKSYENI